jgi:cell division protein FtsA
MRGGLLAALDVGSTKVVCFIALVDPAGKPKVIGIGHQVSQGIRGGIIIDIKQAESSIVAAVHAAEKMAGETIDRVAVNISSSNLTSHKLKVETNISGNQVTEKDISHIISEGYQYFAKDEQEILHCLPIDFAIDDAHGIKDPRGMYGDKLSTDLHVVTASTTTVKNLANCLARCHLDIEDMVASPYASGLACLTEDEKNLGVIALDIGGGNTSVSVFVSGNMVYTNSIAMGGGHITRDIARGVSTSVAYAERLKTLYGSVLANTSDKQEIIDIPLQDPEEEGSEDISAMEVMHISKSDLTAIIRPRAEEILELVKKKLEEGGLDKGVGAKIVLTGGTSQLTGIKELATEVFGKQARIGKPMVLDGMAESTKGPAFSTSAGMLKYMLEKDKLVANLPKPAKEFVGFVPLNQLVRWFKENF